MHGLYFAPSIGMGFEYAKFLYIRPKFRRQPRVSLRSPINTCGKSHHFDYPDDLHHESTNTVTIKGRMVGSAASRSRAAMGQMSSQPQFPSAEAPGTQYQRKSKDMKGKSKKSKRKSAEMAKPIDQEEEDTALALMQIRNAAVQHGSVPYYEETDTLSTQIIAESSPMRPSTKLLRKSKSRKTNVKKGTKKPTGDIYEWTGNEKRSSGVNQYPDLPSTPPGQTDRLSPSPYRPVIPPVSALDDIPTDDDVVAAYEEEFAKDTASADPPGLPDHDMFSSPQQPPNSFEQADVEEEMNVSHQLPTDVYTLPQSAKKHKKKKRKRRTDGQGDESSFAQEQGQHPSQYHPGTIDDFLEIDTSSANLFCEHEGDDMPIDPELNSMNPLPPSTELKNINEDDLNILQKNGIESGRPDTLRPRKRRRLEEMQGADTTGLPYMSPYSFQHDHENIQDQVLPGYEDMQKQASSGSGSSFQDDVSHEDSELSGDEVQVEKSPQRKGKSRNRENQPKKAHETSQNGDEVGREKKEKAENGGAFSAAEGLQLDAFRDNYCESNDMTIGQFNNLIQSTMRGNAQVKALFDEIHDIMSYRPRMSVQKFCRRRFHNFTRGTWSADEEEMLKQAVAQKGKAWKEIGDLLGRMGEDCRDRWRNYIVNAEHRNREQWTDAEVVNLCSAILECMQLMKEDRMRAREEGEDVPESGTESDREVEDMKHINWQAVSDRMGEHGGGRSRLQCSFKWSQLKKREQAEYLRAIKDSRGIEKKPPTPVKNPWRMKLACKKIGNMKTGDLRALLQAVADLEVPEEGNIPWKILGDDDLRTRWTSTEKKVAWSSLKEKVPGFESLDYHTVANQLLSQVINEDAEDLNERWDPDLHGDVSAKKQTRKKRNSGKLRDNKGKEREDMYPTTGYLLTNHHDFTHDSHAMDGNAGHHTGLNAFEPPGFHPYNVLPMADGMVNASNGVVLGSMNGDDQDEILDNGSTNNANAHDHHHLSIADGDVSPEFEGRMRSALNAHNLSLLSNYSGRNE